MSLGAAGPASAALGSGGKKTDKSRRGHFPADGGQPHGKPQLSEGGIPAQRRGPGCGPTEQNHKAAGEVSQT